MRRGSGQKRKDADAVDSARGGGQHENQPVKQPVKRSKLDPAAAAPAPSAGAATDRARGLAHRPEPQAARLKSAIVHPSTPAAAASSSTVTQSVPASSASAVGVTVTPRPAHARSSLSLHPPASRLRGRCLTKGCSVRVSAYLGALCSDCKLKKDNARRAAAKPLTAQAAAAKAAAGATTKPAPAVRFSQDNSTVLNTIPKDRVAALRDLLGPDRRMVNAKLIYRASRDGRWPVHWWSLCGGKSNTLTIVRVRNTNCVFAIHAPFEWPATAPTEDAWIADPTGETCIISLTNVHGRAVKLRLKEDCKEKAARVSTDLGPQFGDGDVVLSVCGRPVDWWKSCSAFAQSFEFDRMADRGPPIVYDKHLLAGSHDWRNESADYFFAHEIETWKLEP